MIQVLVVEDSRITRDAIESHMEASNASLSISSE